MNSGGVRLPARSRYDLPEYSGHHGFGLRGTTWARSFFPKILQMERSLLGRGEPLQNMRLALRIN